MLNNPDRTISIHDIGKLLGDAYPKAFTPTNIVSGFTVTGTCPFNPDVFGDHEFAPSYVTDQPAEGSTTDCLVQEEITINITGWSSCINYILPKTAINKRGPDLQKGETLRASPVLQGRALQKTSSPVEK